MKLHNSRASQGNARDFGDIITVKRSAGANAANQTRGCFGWWIHQSSPFDINIIDFVEIASWGDAQDFGDLTIPLEIF